MTTLSVSDVLDRAADLIEPEGAWVQGCGSRSALRNLVSPHSDKAVCWCVVTAVSRVAGDNELAAQARDSVRRLLGVACLVPWNDAPGRKQSEVVLALREAATLSRSSENRNGASHG